MAIISHLTKVPKFFPDTDPFTSIFSYFSEALEINSNVHKRIFESPEGTFRKVPLTDDVFALEQVFYTKDRSKCFTESHRNYIDFQLLLSGEEMMEYADIDSLTVTQTYSPEKDLIIYDDNADFSKFLMKSGTLAVFFPEDAHVGLPFYKEPSLVYKTVIKLPVIYI